MRRGASTCDKAKGIEKYYVFKCIDNDDLTQFFLLHITERNCNQNSTIKALFNRAMEGHNAWLDCDLKGAHWIQFLVEEMAIYDSPSNQDKRRIIVLVEGAGLYDVEFETVVRDKSGQESASAAIASVYVLGPNVVIRGGI